MRGVRLPLTAIFLSILLFSGASSASEKCELAAGYLLEYEDEIEFGVSIHRCAGFWRLELEEFGGRLANGEPVWKVLDLLEVPKAASDETVVSQTCSISGVADEGIVVVAEQSDEEWFAKIHAAWWADTKRGQWKSLDPRTVRCWNESAGL